MSIKEKIINKVNAIENPKILDSILNLISMESETDEIYQFSEEEKALLQEGLKDVENGNVFTQAESNKMISKWLEEKSSGLLEL